MIEPLSGHNGAGYVTLVKRYGTLEGPLSPERTYSPAACTGAQQHVLMGNPSPAIISSSCIERQHLAMRMRMRRVTRLTNASLRTWRVVRTR